MSDKVSGKNGISRRGFIKAGAVVAGCAMMPELAFADTKDYILVGHPAPITGPIAAFGQTSSFIDKYAVAEINKKGGIFLKDLGKRLPIKVISMDTESSPTKAANIANTLILKEKVDLMVASGTPDTINPVSAICERNEVPCVNTFGPLESWMTGGPYKWAFLFFTSLDLLINNHLGVWDEVGNKTNKVVGGIWPNDPDGVVFAKAYKDVAEKRGYKIVDVGRFPYGLQDFSTFINTWKKEKVEILEGVPIPPDFAVLWRQCHEMGFIPKMATISKAILFPAAVNAIGGNLANGLITDLIWSPAFPFKSSLTGISCAQLAQAWTEKTGKQWTAPLGFDYTLFEIITDALHRAGSLNKGKIREALATTNLETIRGHIKFNKENYSATPLVMGQWIKGTKWPWDLACVYNKLYPEVPVTNKMIFPLT